ncbi:MAG: glycosyltransferase family 2 protein [Rhodospirillaceae bacterium]|nr:glycosyltransferase family 2 protein [Rhodospirillaceae bacterium]MBT5190873.1 glycosyltransferase family 2 protein [Rhodospirillaceae bacterium]MBT5459573.1 glycosyltransferase family 2 protein [Rhodospirillaceae bacterium]
MNTGTDGKKADLTGAGVSAPRLSIITPIFNEEKNIENLISSIVKNLEPLDQEFEIIAVNDGSRDKSIEILESLAKDEHRLKVIDLRRNFGQTAAMMAGIDASSGSTIILIDADMQNDPADIPILLEKMDEGYDVVSGWRKDRKDAPLKRNLVSRVANFLISRISGIRLHDYGCTLKAYRADVVQGGWRLYGEMHRFIPIYAGWMGARVAEIPVRHYPRAHGKSNYGLERIFKVILDLTVTIFIHKYFVKPIYVFGGFGFIFLLLSMLSFMATLYLKIFAGISMIETPLPLFSAFTFMTGIMCILMGLLAEMLARTYFESQQRRSYEVRQHTNFDAD